MSPNRATRAGDPLNPLGASGISEDDVTVLHHIFVFLLMMALSLGALPLEAQNDPSRSATGGAQTLEDILARQRGEVVDDSSRRRATGVVSDSTATTGQLGTLGVTSDAEVFRALRYGTAKVSVSSQGPAVDVLIQDGGMRWLELRRGTLTHYGGYLLLGMIGLLVLFYLLRGQIRIEGEKTGRTILRFTLFERFGHWLLAGSFIVLGITGLILLFGRLALIPLFGKEAFAEVAAGAKWLHDNIAWAFILGLILVFIFWVLENLPNRTDLKWLAQGGGLFTKSTHPPAKKFNAGQKMLFWVVIILGISISASGLSLLFPFELPMFYRPLLC